MKKAVILFISISFIVTSGLFAQSKKELKKQKQQEEYQATKKLVESGKFIFVPDWATTNKGRRINLSGEGYTLKFDDKSTSADLPFFGQAYTATYGGNGGIEFKNLDTAFKIDYNDKKNKIVIKFSTSHQSENFDIYLSIFSNGNSSLSISSSSRSIMKYDGKVKEIPLKKED